MQGSSSAAVESYASNIVPAEEGRGFEHEKNEVSLTIALSRSLALKYFPVNIPSAYNIAVRRWLRILLGY